MARCLSFPFPTLPTLGGGLSLGAAIPSQSFNAELCCKVLSIAVVTPPLPLGSLVFNPGVMAALNTAIATFNTYHDAFVFNCPFE